MGHDNTQNETLNESVNDHLDTDLVDKNVLNAMVLDNITQNYPGIKQFFSTIKLIEVNDKFKAQISVLQISLIEKTNMMESIRQELKETSDEENDKKTSDLETQLETVRENAEISDSKKDLIIKNLQVKVVGLATAKAFKLRSLQKQSLEL